MGPTCSAGMALLRTLSLLQSGNNLVSLIAATTIFAAVFAILGAEMTRAESTGCNER